MKRHFLKKLMAGVALGAMPIAALAQVSVGKPPLQLRSDFIGYSLSASGQLTYTDNVLLVREEEAEGDAIASLILSGGVFVDRPRFTGLVSGDVQIGTYLDPVTDGAGNEQYDRLRVNRNVTGAGTFKIKDNLFYVDVGLAAQQQALGLNSLEADRQGAANQQRADALSFSVSPYLYSRLSNDGAVEARYRYTKVYVDDDGQIEGIDNYLNDSETHEVLASYDSGGLMDRLRVVLNVYGNTTSETGSDVLPEVDYTQNAVYADVTYPLNRRLSVTGTIGYDDVDTNGNPFFTDDEISGAFWKAGLIATPGRKTRAELAVGERYGGTWVDGSAEYKLSSRLAIRGDVSRTFQTRAQGVSQSFGRLQSNTLGYIDALRESTDLTANEIAGRAVTFNSNLTDFNRGRSGLSASDTASLSIIGQNPRTNLVITGGYDNSDFGFQQTESIFLGTRIERRLSRRNSVYGRADIRKSDTSIGQTFLECTLALSTDPVFASFTAAEITAICQNPSNFTDEATTLNLAIGARRQLGDNVSAYAQIGRTERSSDNVNLGYEENAITVGVTYDF